MDVKNIFLILACVLDFTLAFFVYFSNRKKQLNIVYGSMAIWTGLWTLGIALFRYSSNYDFQLFWNREFILMSAIIASSFLHFSFIFSNKEINLKNWKILLMYLPNLLVLWAVLTPGVMIKNIITRDWGNESILGWGYIYFGIYFGFIWLWGTINLIKKYLKSSGIFKDQLKYVFAGISVSMIFGATFNLILILLGNYQWIWLGPYASFIFLLTTTYAIVRYRLMDIRIAIRKIVFYIITASFAYGFFYFLIWFYLQFFGGFYNSKTYVTGAIIALIFVWSFVLFNKIIKNLTNKYLFFTLYNSQETMAKLTDELTNSIDLNKIVDSIVNSIKNAMDLDRAGVLLIDQNEGTIKYKIAKVIGFNETNGISLVQDNFLTQYLEKTQRPLVRDELQLISRDSNNVANKQKFNQLAENMKQIEASLCLPMIILNKLIGIIVLGSKTSGGAYTSEDLTLLITLSKQAAVAVENARLYGEVRDLNENLQQKVDEQTKEIREQKDEIQKAYEVEKQAHEDLIKLDEAKTNFMLVTQHHLRTPLSITMGFLDLLLSGHFGKIPKKVLETIQKSQQSIQKEIEVVDDLLNVSAFQLGHGYVQLQPCVPIKKMLEEIIADLASVAEKKNIYLKFKSGDNIPEITVDRKQIKMALQNIVDNAIKYTKKGGVAVKINSENDKIKIEVKDTGIGMNEKDKKYLFDKPFQRSEEAWSANATGKGIGVYLSAQIIKAHGGDIKAKSEGRGKGSTFNIELPVDATPFANKKPVSLASGKLITK